MVFVHKLPPICLLDRGIILLAMFCLSDAELLRNMSMVCWELKSKSGGGFSIHYGVMNKNGMVYIMVL